MYIRKVNDSKHPSYLITDWEGDEQYYIYNNWKREGDKEIYLGHEIYEISGGFRKIGQISQCGELEVLEDGLLLKDSMRAKVFDFCRKDIDLQFQ